MKSNFSKAWKSSTKPNKQRKYRFNAPLHIKANFLNVHLSKELKQKLNTRSIRVRVGDKVKIMRGQFKKQEGKVDEVDMTKLKLFVSKIEHVKKDGTKARYPIEPSNVMIVELNTDDKRRINKTKKPVSEKKQKETTQKETKQTTETKAEVKKPAQKSKSQ